MELPYWVKAIFCWNFGNFNAREVKKIIYLELSLLEVWFNPHEVTLSHQSEILHSLIFFYFEWKK